MKFDVIILGAGGAGMFCASEAARRGRRVAIIDHARKPGGKILISGGGRCNFTNQGASPRQYVSENEHFCKSALSRFTAQDFIQRVRDRGITFHEKTLGQLFCDDSAQQIVDMLVDSCKDAGVEFFLNTSILKVEKPDHFRVTITQHVMEADSLVIATGGLSLPKLGATDIGYKIATQFGLKVCKTDPALDGFVFGPQEQEKFSGLAGISVDAEVISEGVTFRENILFTHSGLSGPAALQASLYWHSGSAVQINFLPTYSNDRLLQWFENKKSSPQESKNALSELIPKRLAERIGSSTPMSQLSKKEQAALTEALTRFTFTPSSTVGYQKAEVTRGGVDTNELSSKTMESKKIPGLYFIGEVVDVTGWLGGYNFQWAWSSGWAAGQVV